MKQVKNYSYLYRDENTNAILNIDECMYQNYINSKNKIVDAQKRIDIIENEMADIKTLLKTLLENK